MFPIPWEGTKVTKDVPAGVTEKSDSCGVDCGAEEERGLAVQSSGHSPFFASIAAQVPSPHSFGRVSSVQLTKKRVKRRKQINNKRGMRIEHVKKHEIKYLSKKNKKI